MIGEEDLPSDPGESVVKEEDLSEGDTLAWGENNDKWNETVKTEEISITKHEPCWSDCEVKNIGNTNEELFGDWGEVESELHVTEGAPKSSNFIKQEDVEPEYVCTDSGVTDRWDVKTEISVDPLGGNGTRPEKLDRRVKKVAAGIGDAPIHSIPESMKLGDSGANDDLSAENVFSQENNLPQEATSQTGHSTCCTVMNQDTDANIVREGDACAMCDSHTQTIITRGDKMSALLEQGERQIQQLTCRANACENLISLLTGVEVQLTRIADNMAKKANSGHK